MNEKREEQPSPVTIFSVGGPLKTYCDFHSHDSFLSHCLNSLLQPWNPVELETGTMNIVYIVWKWWNCEKSRWFQWSIYIKCCSDQSHKGGNFEDVVSIMLNYSKKTTKQTLSETFITSRLVDNSDSLGQNFCTCPCEKILQKSSKGPPLWNHHIFCLCSCCSFKVWNWFQCILCWLEKTCFVQIWF